MTRWIQIVQIKPHQWDNLTLKRYSISSIIIKIYNPYGWNAKTSDF